MMRFIQAAFIIVMLSSCAATWPSVCPVDGEVRRCKCAVATFTIANHPTKPSPPAGVVTLDCDGVAVPVQVYAERVDR